MNKNLWFSKVHSWRSTNKVTSQWAQSANFSVSRLWTALIGSTLSLSVSASIPEASPKELLETVPAAAQVCLSCHGVNGEGLGVAGPRLAGLSSEYMAQQLSHFQSGKRQNSTMMAMAMTVQGDTIKLVSDFFAAKPVAAISLQYRGDKVVISDIGEKLAFQGDWEREIPACTSCHGPSGIGAGQFPRLAGQEPSYFKNQLLAWQKGTRTGDVDNMMGNIAKKLTAAEIDALTQYFSAQK
ncbi:c-type cytochrome [Shewanella japonica]|uniref:Cytochrome c4 n=1 Tax=Shewanella japonica TaxID=93973 RepID=A0ABN4Y961_9GAMM|nr:c-type cytochrome [Shewanella japonica]ARD20976.1 Cytochrome c4 [Shewanella japonica]